MPLGGFLGKLFGSSGQPGGAKTGETVDYEGFAITPEPMAQNGQYLTAGRIRKSVDGEEREHHFIRADLHSGFDDACTFTVMKAQQIIDQQGDKLFDQRQDRD